jgi:exodeoxyribonuclease-3
MFQARAKDAGWRIDYFLVTNRLAEKISATPIYSDIMGSDHCPVGLEISV